MKNLKLNFAKTILAIFSSISLMCVPVLVLASDGHDHGEADHHGHSSKKKEPKSELDHSEKEDGHIQGNDDHDHHGHAEDDHDEHEADSFGKGKAIVDVREDGGTFRLAEEAQKLMGLMYSTVKASGSRGRFSVSSEALVYFNDEKGIFVKKDGWFSLVEVEIVKNGTEQVVVSSKHLAIGEKVVVAGTGLLRVAHLQASGQGGKGHAH